MSKNILLVISNLSKISNTFLELKNHIPNIVYIHLLNNYRTKTNKLIRGPGYSSIVTKLYASSLEYSDAFDVRVFLSNLKLNHAVSSKAFPKPIDVLIYDREISNQDREQIERRFSNVTKIVTLESATCTDTLAYENLDDEVPCEMYDNVVLGGTFDRIHLGHKLLLTEAVLRTKKRLVIGVTDVNMIQSKKLPELILPVNDRISHLRDFLRDVDDTVDYEIVPIQDPFGPTKSDPNLDLIVVSDETLRGGQKVNEVRTQNNLKPLKIHCIKLVEINHSSDMAEKEIKISSSNKRMDMLGLRIREPEPKPLLPSRPYVIGLVGGIASGKTVMSRRLEKLGAKVVDCDKLAHTLYEPGQICYDELRNHFGQQIIAENGEIDRKKLGSIVFSDTGKLNELNSIVWPRLQEAVKRIIRESDSDVIVLEAAVLIRAGWQSDCHEVWSCIIPREEAVKRVMERNNMSEEEAKSRVDAQIDNETIVKHSNVVFSSVWSYEYSQSQAEKAWKSLMDTLRNKTKL